MKHSAGQPQCWKNNRQLTRGGGRSKQGEWREERPSEVTQGGNVSYGWMFHEWHTEAKSDWQQLVPPSHSLFPIRFSSSANPSHSLSLLPLLSFTCLLRHPRFSDSYRLFHAAAQNKAEQRWAWLHWPSYSSIRSNWSGNNSQKNYLCQKISSAAQNWSHLWVENVAWERDVEIFSTYCKYKSNFGPLNSKGIYLTGKTSYFNVLSIFFFIASP